MTKVMKDYSGNDVVVRPDGSRRVSLSFKYDPGLTEQSHKDSCDINRIMATYAKTGQMPILVDRVPQYGDFSSVHDYHSALNAIVLAEDVFMELSASIRKEFDNDPAKFLEAVEDPAQRDRLVELGVLSTSEADNASGLPTPVYHGSVNDKASKALKEPLKASKEPSVEGEKA